jgi:outer membrane protein
MSGRWGAAVCALALAAAVASAQESVPSAQAFGGLNPPSTSMPAAEKTTLTVELAIAKALANQPLIQQAQAAVEAARARVGQAQSAWYPRVSASGSYNHVLPDETIAFGALGSFSLVPVDVFDFNVGASLVIFQFGKTEVQVKLAESGVSAARIGLEQIRTSLAFQTAQGFYTVLFLTKQLAAVDSQLQNLREHLDATRIKAQTGSATRYDELATEVRISVLESQRIDAESQLNKQSIGLKQLLGLPESAVLDLVGGFPAPAATGEDEQQLLANAMTQRNDVKQAVEGEGAAELNRRLATNGAWPTLSAHAAMGYKNGILTASNLNINALQFNWVAGLQLNVPIFQGFLIARMGEEAEKKVAAAQENTRAVKLSAATQVMQAIQDVEAGRRQVQSSEAQLTQAQEMLQVVKLEYELGMLTNIEYLDAQAALERAQLGSIQASYREVLSEYALKQAAGVTILP